MCDENHVFARREARFSCNRKLIYFAGEEHTLAYFVAFVDVVDKLVGDLGFVNKAGEVGMLQLDEDSDILDVLDSTPHHLALLQLLQQLRFVALGPQTQLHSAHFCLYHLPI
jgi:hypothetical protein